MIDALFVHVSNTSPETMQESAAALRALAEILERHTARPDLVLGADIRPGLCVSSVKMESRGDLIVIARREAPVAQPGAPC